MYNQGVNIFKLEKEDSKWISLWICTLFWPMFTLIYHWQADQKKMHGKESLIVVMNLSRPGARLLLRVLLNFIQLFFIMQPVGVTRGVLGISQSDSEGC